MSQTIKKFELSNEATDEYTSSGIRYVKGQSWNFELCATFLIASETRDPWIHFVGLGTGSLESMDIGCLAWNT